MTFTTRLISFLFTGLLALPMALQPASATTAQSTAAKIPQKKMSHKIIEIKGEVIDTWCYFSGVMGGTDATRGTAHHTCALWCAAGGIPVGVRTEAGEVYMVLKYKGEDALAPTDAIMEVQSDIITARGKHFVRDGVNYLVVEKVIANHGIQYMSHEDYDSVPPFSAPKPAKKN